MKLLSRIAVSAFALSITCGAVGILRSQASDHRDAPTLETDPALDLTDVYAFMRPVAADGGGFAPSSHLVLAMTVFPNAPATAGFDPDGEFVFNIGAANVATGIDTTVDVIVSCRFQPAADGGHQPFICSANGFFFAGETETVSGSEQDPLRVFAGRRADPAFGAVGSVLTAIEAGVLPDAADGGASDFATENVLAIVAEIDVDRVLFAEGGRRPIAVSATTERLPR